LSCVFSGSSLRKVLEQNRKIDKDRLIRMHSELVKLDYSLKTSNLDEDLALELFVSGIKI